MSIDEPITQRQLIATLLKLAAILAMVLVLGTFLVSNLLSSDAVFSKVAGSSIVFAIAFAILTSGAFSLLKIVDWFEARKAKKND